MKKQMKNQKSEKEMKINLKGTQMKLSSLIEWLSRKTIVAACGFALLVAGLSVAPALVIADPPDPLDTGNDFKVADVSFKLPVKGWEKSDGISDYFTQGTGLQFLSAQNVEQSAEVSVVVYPESDSFTLDAGIPEDAKPSINDTKDGVLYKIWNLGCKNGENCDSTVAKAAKDVDGKRAVWTVIKNNEDPENDIKIDQAYMDKFIESISGDSQVAPKENKAESKPSPTPSATSEPSPTPSVEPSATPEPSASPSTSPEAKASPSPSPSPSATSAAEEPKTDVAEENAETKSSLLKDFDSKTGNFSFAKPPQSGQELLLLFTKLQMEFSNDIKKTYIDASTTEETSKDTFLQSAAKAISDVVEEKAGEFDKEYKNLIPGNSEFKLPELQKAIEKQGAENSNKYTFEYLFGDAQTFLSKDANPIKERVGLDEIANRLSELVDKGEANKLSTEVLKHGIDGSSVVNSINELKNVLSDLYVNHSDKNDANVRGVVKALAENKNVPNISEISEKFASAYSSADPITGEGGNTAYFEKLINVLTKSNVLSVGSEKTKLDIYEACELAAALNSDYNSATFELRKKFNELFTQSIEFSTSSLAQAMSYDLIKQEANKGVLGESLASITSLLSTNLDQEDAKNLEISVERIRSGIETQREIKAKTQSNLNKLIQNDIELDRKYADSETKLRIEEGRFYDEAKPSVYNYSLDKWFVPYVFNSMAYHGVDDSIPVGVREIFYQTDAKLDSAAQENPLTRSGVYSSEKNPYINYKPDVTLKNTFSNHLFSNTNDGLQGAAKYEGTVVKTEDLKKIVNSSNVADKSAGLDGVLGKAGFQLLPLDYVYDKGFKNQCADYYTSDKSNADRQKCIVPDEDLSPRDESAYGSGNLYYTNLDLPQSLNSNIYKGAKSTYKSLGWVAGDSAWNLDSKTAENYKDPEVVRYDDSADGIIEKDSLDISKENFSYYNNSVQKVEVLDSKAQAAKGAVTLAKVFTGSDVNDFSMKATSDNGAIDDAYTYNPTLKDGSEGDFYNAPTSAGYAKCSKAQGEKKCERYFNTETVNWLEYRALSDLPNISDEQIRENKDTSVKELKEKREAIDQATLREANPKSYYEEYEDLVLPKVQTANAAVAVTDSEGLRGGSNPFPREVVTSGVEVNGAVVQKAIPEPVVRRADLTKESGFVPGTNVEWYNPFAKTEGSDLQAIYDKCFRNPDFNFLNELYDGNSINDLKEKNLFLNEKWGKNTPDFVPESAFYRCGKHFSNADYKGNLNEIFAAEKDIPVPAHIKSAVRAEILTQYKVPGNGINALVDYPENVVSGQWDNQRAAAAYGSIELKEDYDNVAKNYINVLESGNKANGKAVRSVLPAYGHACCQPIF